MSETAQNSQRTSELAEKKETPTARALRFTGNSAGATLIWLGVGPAESSPGLHATGLITLAPINSATASTLWLSYTRESLRLLKKAGYAFTATAMSISGTGATFISASCLQNALPVMPGACNYGFSLGLTTTLLSATTAAGAILDLRRK